jgi:hypothetical protein
MCLAPFIRPERPYFNRPRRLWGPHSTRYRLLRAFDALPHAARFTCIRPLSRLFAMSKRQRVEWIDTVLQVEDGRG